MKTADVLASHEDNTWGLLIIYSAIANRSKK